MRFLHAILALSLAGCALGEDGVNRRRDGGSVGIDAATPPECDPPCGSGTVCSDGACVSEALDADSDGVPAISDCDDGDPTIGSTGERLCSSACGEGLTRCTDGVWTDCDAPLECECAAGAEPRTLDCGNCGTQRQVCTDGTWVNDGACAGSGACMPSQVETGAACGSCGTLERRCTPECSWGTWVCVGEGECMNGATESESRACGTCSTGTQTRTRTCTGCAWGAWGSFGTCSGGGGECTPGQTDTDTRACGNCSLGSQSRTRTCGGGCTWGAWSAYGTCSGGGTCSPGATRAGSCDPCSQQVCSSSCTWGGCTLRSGSQCDWESGTNWRCCGSSRWQFCLSSCVWSTDCATCSGCGC